MRLRVSGIDEDRERQLQQEEECTTIAAITTDYNTIDRVPYFGLMFEIFPRMDLELLTIELDIRIPRGETDPDLSIEVYSMIGSYELLKAYDDARWSLVSTSKLVPVPGGGGGIIPSNEFAPLQIKAKERMSLYISMKGPYIDFNAFALDKTGELQLRTSEMDILVGVGYNSYNFPGTFDTILDPQFAGTLHVRKTAECSLFIATTTVEYNVLVGEELSSELMGEISQVFDDAINTLMQTDSTLLEYQQKFGLEKKDETKTGRAEYSGKVNCLCAFFDDGPSSRLFVAYSPYFRLLSTELWILSDVLHAYSRNLQSLR
jgi:hypothetical protein